jgi:transcriptional regulator with XRE-family HTH domain
MEGDCRLVVASRREVSVRIKLREWRLVKIMTQEELSKLSGVTEATISRIESGQHEARISTIRKLASALGIEPQVLVAGPGGDEGKVAA